MIRCRSLRSRGRNWCSARRVNRACRGRSIRWIGKSLRRRKRRDCRRFRLRSYANNWRSMIKSVKITNKLRICRSRSRKWRTKMNYSMSLSRVLNCRFQPRPRSKATPISLSNSRMTPTCLKSTPNTPRVYLTKIKVSPVCPHKACCSNMAPLNLISWASRW